MENSFIDERAHICYICNGEGATMEGDCPNCRGTGLLDFTEEEEDELREIKWTMGEIEVALELLAEMRLAMGEFYDKDNVQPLNKRYEDLGRKLQEWFDE